VSRLVLKPALVLSGRDPATDYDVEYSSENGELTIGCQTHSLKNWKRRGAAIIVEAKGEGLPCDCGFCKADDYYAKQLAATNRYNAARVREFLPRLEKLIATIEQAESALKKSLRAQTKRT
jgi:hypothetical protein